MGLDHMRNGSICATGPWPGPRNVMPSRVAMSWSSRLWGTGHLDDEAGEKEVSLALDTAATHTHLIPDVLDEIGYSPRHGDKVTSITSAIGDEPGT